MVCALYVSIKLIGYTMHFEVVDRLIHNYKKYMNIIGPSAFPEELSPLKV